MVKYISRPFAMIVSLEGDDVFGESVTKVSVDDEAGGEFLVIEQCNDDGDHKLKFDFDELEIVCKTARRLRKAYEKKSG